MRISEYLNQPLSYWDGAWTAYLKYADNQIIPQQFGISIINGSVVAGHETCTTIAGLSQCIRFISGTVQNNGTNLTIYAVTENNQFGIFNIKAVVDFIELHPIEDKVSLNGPFYQEDKYCGEFTAYRDRKPAFVWGDPFRGFDQGVFRG